MKKTKQLTTLILLAAMLRACGESGAPADTTGSSDAPDTKTAPADPAEADELPALDFGGEDFVISVQDYGAYTGRDLFVEEATGDVVDDAIYAKNQAVSERLNVNLVFDSTTHYWDDQADYLTRIRSSVMAGDAAWDMIFGLGYFLPGFTGEGILADMSGLPYIDLSKKWWNSSFMEAASVDGKYYFVTGDAALTLIKNMFCTFVNLDLYDKLGVKENLYDIVKSGDWTLDKAAEICAPLYADLNGDTTVDKDDQFGLLYYANNQATGFFEACGVDIINREGKDFIFDFGNAHNADVVERLCRFYHESEGIFYDPNPGGETETVVNSPFRNGNVLMTGGWLAHADSYRDLNFRYGVLPYPKFDENQAEYHTTTLTSYTVFCVPADCKAPDRTAAVLEAMASESWRSVTPAYFETALKVKYAADDETAQMFDLIRDNISFDFGYIYTLSMNGISDRFKTAVNENKPEWASNVAGFEASAVDSLDKLLTTIRNVE